MQEDLKLKYIAKHSIAHPTDLEERFDDAYMALLNLQRHGLIIKALGRIHSFALTEKGYKASEIGFKSFLNEEKRTQLLKEKHENLAFRLIRNIQ